MRIGLFTDAYLPQIGGVSTSVALLKEELLRLGHQVYVFTTTDPEQPQDEYHVTRVPSLPFVSAKRVALVYDPLLALKVLELKLDVIHTQTEFGLGVFGRSIARLTRVPHLHTYHTIYEDWLRDQLKAVHGPNLLEHVSTDYIRWRSKAFCNLAQAVVAPTEKTERLLRSYGVHRPIHIIPTGIELKNFGAARRDEETRRQLRQRLGLQETDRVLLYLGRISQEKHIAELMDYLEPRLAARPDLHFVLIGDGPHRAELTARTVARALTGQVHFPGPVPLQEVPAYYAMADFFLSASQSETQGLTYIEALASGTPILVRRDPCLEGVVQEGENGYFFEDCTSFDTRLDGLLGLNPAAWTELSRQAQRSVERYSIEAFAAALCEVYEDLRRQGRHK